TGMDIGKTLVKYQGLTVGKVVDMSIDKDLNGVDVSVIMDYRAAFNLADFATVSFGFGTFCFTMLFIMTLFLMREYDLEHMWSY
ncbi:paraquat-inducible protein A, partial [Shewanella sp. MBTL60-112-B1]|uniref:paraquat-inducible protein A n=1 Tax=Shewanella sp. MBTL60-112-B1 TaxID=2815916 RepID=UPI001C7D5FB4